jgi:hypothetical protein
MILDHVLSAQLPARLHQQLDEPGSDYGISARHVWAGEGPPSYLAPAFRNPRYIESADPGGYSTYASFRDAMRTEYRGRAEEKLYWRVFGDLVSEVENPDDFIKLVDVFDFLYQNSRHAEDNITPPRFACRIINRAAELAADEYDGSANPDEVADTAMPSVVYLLAKRDARETGESAGRTAKQLSSALLSNAVEGTAERVAGIRMRVRLDAQGFSGFGHNRRSRLQQHSTSERYLTRTALIRISGLKTGFNKGLPISGADVVDAIQALTLQTVQDEANGGNAIASQLIGAFERMSSGKGYKVAGVASTRGMPVGAVIHVANIVAVQLNKQHNLTGDQQLQQFDRNDIAELPAAFQRILYAMNPKLLEQATALVPFTSAPQLRRRMIYIEALSGQWRDLERITGPTIGDYVLQMYARGQRAEAIQQGLQLLAEGSPDKLNSRFRGIAQDPRTKQKRVVSERQRPGHGVIS